MRHIQKWWFWSILGPIYPRENKNITKNQHFPKNCILTTMKSHKFQVLQKSQNSYKIIFKKYIFRPKIDFLS